MFKTQAFPCTWWPGFFTAIHVQCTYSRREIYRLNPSTVKHNHCWKLPNILLRVWLQGISYDICTRKQKNYTIHTSLLLCVCVCVQVKCYNWSWGCISMNTTRFPWKYITTTCIGYGLDIGKPYLCDFPCIGYGIQYTCKPYLCNFPCIGYGIQYTCKPYLCDFSCINYSIHADLTYVIFPA